MKLFPKKKEFTHKVPGAPKWSASGVLSEIELLQVRQRMENNFRATFYKDPKFPFLQSLGVTHVIQSFEIDNVGYIGMLHLWWVPPKNPQISAIWESQWIDDPYEGVKLAVSLDETRCYDVHKLREVHKNYLEDHKRRKDLKEAEEAMLKEQEEMSKKVLWN